ncbi:glycoside hydrolase family 74 protein [Thozetella sp. PMI_491]|nr:glycoside hydrolase family 74 protein [Thozetella sp. PMI_491]
MRGLTTALLLLVAAGAEAGNLDQDNYDFNWKNVHIGGGGGFVPGIVFHPTVKGIAYARTDIGGLYRLNADDSWTAVTDKLGTHAGWHNWGIDAVALDPQDPNMVYAAVGLYTNSWDGSPGSIIRSSDKGATWSFANLTFKVGGNMPGRGMGERLAVDPHNSKVLYFGARSGNGLWKSTDGGATFSKVPSFTNTGTFVVDPTDANGYNSDKMGLTFVTFDSTSDVKDGLTSRIFVGTADNITASVYVSNDAGVTWIPVPNQPGKHFPHKARLQPAEKALYLTYADGIGPFDGTKGAVYRYDITNGTWKDITPVTGSDLNFGFGGLGLDLLHPGTLVVASLNSWWPDAKLFRSNNSGATWSPIWEWTNYPAQNWYYGLHTDNAPWINAGFISQDSKRLGWMIESLEIDPLDSDHWLYGTGLTLYGGHDLTKWDTVHNITISSLADGIEETSVQGLASVPGGTELLAAVGDDSGFTFLNGSDIRTAPKTNWMNPEWDTSTDVDYAGNQTNKIVRVGKKDAKQQVALSDDGGVTWSAHPGASTSDSGGTVAYSADGTTILWSSSASGVLRSQSGGPFQKVTSVPALAVVAADRRNGSVFYTGSGGIFQVSADGGLTFAKGGTLGSATSIRDLATHPTQQGEVWASTDVGLFRSTDYGALFAKVGSDLTNTYQMAFGLGYGSLPWYTYAFGTGSAGPKLYARASSGSQWLDIQGGQGFGDISSCKLAGSGNVRGQVYIGTNGRGVFYG